MDLLSPTHRAIKDSLARDFPTPRRRLNFDEGIGLRKEIPFEWWYFHYQNKTNDSCENWKQRGWAVLDLCLGALKIIYEAMLWCAIKIAKLVSLEFEKPYHTDILGAQCRGFLLSVHAIWSPDGAKTAEGIKDIGCPLDNWTWGTVIT